MVVGTADVRIDENKKMLEDREMTDEYAFHHPISPSKRRPLQQ